MPLWVFFLMVLTLSGGCHCSSHSPTLRMPRYADAIFSNSYRKVLGQLFARKLLQDIMSRQQAKRNQEQGAKVWLGRQVDSMWEDQKQMALESILAALSQKLRLKARGFTELKFTEQQEGAYGGCYGHCSPSSSTAANTRVSLVGLEKHKIREFPRMKILPVFYAAWSQNTTASSSSYLIFDLLFHL